MKDGYPHTLYYRDSQGYYYSESKRINSQILSKT
ncbi:hypothetical protein ACEQPO_08855 [Bacillus sp. SL00103]